MKDEEKGRSGAHYAAQEKRMIPSLPDTAGALYVRGRQSRYRQATAEQIVQAARELVERRACRGTCFKDPSVSRQYFSDRLAGLEREVFAAVFLDIRHRLVEAAELFFGTVDGAEVHPREIVRKALLCNAAAAIVAHNHPSGDVEPSAADRTVTARLKQALALVDIRLLDHVIVGGRQSLSLAARGWL